MVDAGSSLSGSRLSNASQGAVILEGMNGMDYDGMSLGRYDAQIGLEALQKRKEEATFPFLAANLGHVDGGALLFEPHTVVERNGLRIGLIGLSGPDVLATKVKDKLLLYDPIAAARQSVAALQGQVDLVVLLSHLGLETDRQLAQQIEGIQVIVGGLDRKLLEEPERVGNTLIVQAGYNGEWLGRLDAAFTRDGTPVEYRETILTLDASYADDPAMIAVVDKWKGVYPPPTVTPLPVPPTTKQ